MITGLLAEDSAERVVLKPVPRRRVEHLTGTEHTLQRAELVLPRGRGAVTHEQADRGRRSEHATHAMPLDDAVKGLGVGMVERALVRDRRAPDEQRRGQQRPERQVRDLLVTREPRRVQRRAPADLIRARQVAHFRPRQYRVKVVHHARNHLVRGEVRHEPDPRRRRLPRELGDPRLDMRQRGIGRAVLPIVQELLGVREGVLSRALGKHCFDAEVARRMPDDADPFTPRDGEEPVVGLP